MSSFMEHIHGRDNGTLPPECDYCGATTGCTWRDHPEARADVAAWERERHREEFPFGDHTEY